MSILFSMFSNCCEYGEYTFGGAHLYTLNHLNSDGSNNYLDKTGLLRRQIVRVLKTKVSINTNIFEQKSLRTTFSPCIFKTSCTSDLLGTYNMVGVSVSIMSSPGVEEGGTLLGRSCITPSLSTYLQSTPHLLSTMGPAAPMKLYGAPGSRRVG